MKHSRADAERAMHDLDEGFDVDVSLAAGALRSSKTLYAIQDQRSPANGYQVLHEIDGTR